MQICDLHINKVWLDNENVLLCFMCFDNLTHTDSDSSSTEFVALWLKRLYFNWKVKLLQKPICQTITLQVWITQSVSEYQLKTFNINYILCLYPMLYL